MKITKTIMVAIIFCVIGSCIDRYYLNDNVDENKILVIEGTITDNCEEQVVKISYMSSTENPKFNAVSNCLVIVADSNNHIYNFEEDIDNPGNYKGVIPDQVAITGNKFQLIVNTPDGKTYKSIYEEMLPCPPIDSVYYNLEHRETESLGEIIDGLQFYIDFNATDYFGKYYRLIVEETYEYHSTWPKKDYIGIDGRYYDNPIDFSMFVCYKTEINSEIFLLSTQGLNTNKYNKAKLHFVNDHTQRLLFNYSLLVKQHSMSKDAFLYWSILKENNQETGGLYTKHPQMPKGNLYNENDSTEVILGYFSVSSETTKRIIIKDVPELLFNDVGFCHPVVPNGPLPLDPRPLYFVNAVLFDGSVVRGYTSPECIDCTLHGGVIEKPDFFE